MYDPALFDPAARGQELRRQLAVLHREVDRLREEVRNDARFHIDSLEAQVERLERDAKRQIDRPCGCPANAMDTLQHAFDDLAAAIARAERGVRRELTIGA